MKKPTRLLGRTVKVQVFSERFAFVSDITLHDRCWIAYQFIKGRKALLNDMKKEGK